MEKNRSVDLEAWADSRSSDTESKVTGILLKIVVAGDSPEVLPDGWNLKFDVLKTGRQIKCYVNSETGQKFSSKDHFLRYIKPRNTRLDFPRPTKNPIRSPSKINNQMQLMVYKNDRPEWLPHDWILEVKTRASGTKYKCYVEPSTGYKFYSKPEVFRHLETMEQKSSTSKQKETSMSVLPTNKASLQYFNSKDKLKKFTEEDLPPGWIKETKIQKKASGIRKDPFYIDPVSGYAFRSKKDVQRYLESGDIRACRILPKKRDMDEETLPSSAPKCLKLQHPATRRQHNMGKGSSDGNSIVCSEVDSLGERGGKSVSALTTLPIPIMIEIPLHKIPSHNGAESEQKSNANWSAQTKAEVSERNQVNTSASGGRGILNPEADKMQEQNIEGTMKRDESNTTNNNLNKSRNKKELNMPRRSSKRLAGIEPKMATNSMSMVQAISEGNNMQEQNITVCGIKGDENCEGKIQNSMGNSTNAKCNNLLHQSKEQLMLIEHESMASTVSIVQALPKTIRSSKGDMVLALGVTRDGLADKRSEKIKNEPQKELLLHTSTSSSPMHGESSSKSQKLDTIRLVQPEANVSERSSIRLKANISERTPIGPKAKLSEGSQCRMVSVDSGPISAPEVHTMQEQKSFTSGLEGRDQGKNQNNLSTCKTKKEHNFPCRSSKRLAGCEPEQAVNLESSGQAVQNAKTSCRSESNLAIGSTPNGLAGPTSHQFKGGPGIELLQHALTNVNNSLAEPFNESQVFLHGQAVFEDKLQMLDTNKTNKEPVPEPIPSFGEFLSDPCLEFAFKTLTGEIPVEITAKNVMVSTPAPDIVDERKLPKNKTDKSRNGKTRGKSGNYRSTKKVNLPHQSPESRHNSTAISVSFADSHVLKSTAKKSSKIDVLDVGLSPKNLAAGAPQQLRAPPEAHYAHNLSATTNTLPHNRPPSSHMIEHLNNWTANEVEKNSEKAELPPFFSDGDCWSDPCFDFAFKTLTGAIPVEDNFPVQSYFQRQSDTSKIQRDDCFQQLVDTSQTPRDGSMELPEFGLPSFFQTDISVHFDPEKQLATQQEVPSSNPSFLPSGSMSLPGCSSNIGSQQSMQPKENKGLRGKVNS